MAANSTLELTIEVNPSKANAGINSVNTGLSSMEQAAVRASARAAAGIDGFTASMVKGATAGNLLADAIKGALQWVKEWTIGAAKEAAHVARMESAMLALAKAHGINSDAAMRTVEAVQRVGFENEEAIQTINRLIVADLGLSKAEGLAKVAKDAAALKENLTAGEALESIVQAIEFGNARALRAVGMRLDFEKEITIAELTLGKTLSDNEKVQIRYNAVMREAAKIQGAGAAASKEAESMMKALGREVKDLREAVGAKLQDEFKTIIGYLRSTVSWMKDNTDLIGKFAKGAMVLVGIIATITAATKAWALAQGALNLAMSVNPAFLLAGGIAGAGAVIYKEYRDMQERQQAQFAEMKKQQIRQMVGQSGGLAKLRAMGLSDEDIREAMTGKREAEDFGLPKLNIKGSPGPDLEALKLAAEIRKKQAENERHFREAAVEAGAKGKLGFAKDIAEVNADIAKRTSFIDDKGNERTFALTRDAWVSIIDQLERRWGTFKRNLAAENRKQLTEHLDEEQDAVRKRMEWDAHAFQKRLEFDAEWHSKAMQHLREVLAFEEQRAGFARDARLRELDSMDAQTLEQKVAVEGRRADIEIEYLEKVHDIKLRLFDAETSVQAMQYEMTMRTLNLGADVIEKRLAEYTQMREQIRQQQYEATDAAIDAARENAANRQTQLVREHNRSMFESLKQQAGGVFDALLQKSQSVWSAIGNSFKTAILTAMKEIITSRIAAFFTELITGEPVRLSGNPGGKFSSIFGLPRFAEGGITRGPSIVGEAGPELVIPLNKLRNFGLGSSSSMLVGRYGPETDEALEKAALWGINVGLPLGLSAIGGPAGLSVGNVLMSFLTGVAGHMTPPRNDGTLLGMVPFSPSGAGGLKMRASAGRDAIETWLAENPGLRAFLEQNPVTVKGTRNMGQWASGEYFDGLIRLDTSDLKRTAALMKGAPFKPGESPIVHSVDPDAMAVLRDRFVHELGHHIEVVVADAMSKGPGPAATVWSAAVKRNRLDRFGFPDYRTVSEYASRSSGENFAETFAAFMLHPEELKKYNSALYNAMGKVLKGAGIIPSYDTGGTVASTGLAYVHKGEAVIPQADTLKKAIDANTSALRGNAQTTGQLGWTLASLATAAISGAPHAARGLPGAFLTGGLMRPAQSNIGLPVSFPSNPPAPAANYGVPPMVGAGTMGTGGGWTSFASVPSRMWSNLKSLVGFGNVVTDSRGGKWVTIGNQSISLDSWGGKLTAAGRSPAAGMAGTSMFFYGLGNRGGVGDASLIGGGALTGFQIAGPWGAAGGAAAGGFIAGVRRGGFAGWAETGFNPIAGLFILFGGSKLLQGAQEKAREKIKALYGVDISDRKILKQIVDVAKQAFGGNLEVAIRSEQIRELVRLYAMSTGQRPTGMPANVMPVSLAEARGSLFQMPGYQNGIALPSFGGVPSWDTIGTGTPSAAGTPSTFVLNFTMPPEAVNDAFNGRTVQVIVDNPRAVQGATLRASRASVGRREFAALQLSPGLVTS